MNSAENSRGKDPHQLASVVEAELRWDIGEEFVALHSQRIGSRDNAW